MTLTIAVATRAGLRWCASLLILACASSLSAQQPTIQNPHTSPADLPRISNLIQTSRPSGGLERLYS